MSKNGISIKEIYELIDRKISEVNNSVTRLEAKFDSLEAGRLSSLEKEFANFKGDILGRMAVWGIVGSIAISIIIFLANKYL